jgi:hypothetical protein
VPLGERRRRPAGSRAPELRQGAGFKQRCLRRFAIRQFAIRQFAIRQSASREFASGAGIKAAFRTPALEPPPIWYSAWMAESRSPDRLAAICLPLVAAHGDEKEPAPCTRKNSPRTIWVTC